MFFLKDNKIFLKIFRVEVFSMEDIFRKIVSKKELKLTLKASKKNICPKIIQWKKINNDKFEILMEKYTNTLKEETDKLFYQNQVAQLIKKLHSIEIYHYDLHNENFVIKNKVIKLIDFGESEKFKDIKSSQLGFYYNFYSLEPLKWKEFLKEEIEYSKTICEE